MRILFILLLFISILSSAQEKTEEVEPVICPVEKSAEFPGGQRALYEYIAKHFQHPSKHVRMEGKIHVEFIVENDGSVTNIKIKKGIHQSFDSAALEVFKNMPNWIPAQLGQKPIKSKQSVPLLIRYRK